MSDTIEAAVQRIRKDSAIVEAVCRRLVADADPAEAPLLVQFVEIFFSKAPPEFVEERSVEALARMTLGAFRFLQQAGHARVDVEVLNPDVDNEGWYAPVTVIRTNLADRPFIVDTIREYLHSEDVPIEHYIYPVLHVDRDEKGAIVEIRPSREGELRESLVHCEVPRVTDPEKLERIRRELTRRLQDVIRATDDFQPMVDTLNRVEGEMAQAARALPERARELEEVQAFLHWLREGGLVFLGYRGYDILPLEDGRPAIAVEPGSGLGILRNEGHSRYAEPIALDEMEPSLRELVTGGPLLIISKTNAESTVHRRARMDYIGIKKLGPTGKVVGEHRFLGLFTSKAYAEDAERIPILREKLNQILESARVQPGSHDYKEIITIFNSMPKEELFLASAAEIGQDVQAVLTMYHTEGIRVSLREDPLGRGIGVMVILPKDRFSGEVRKNIELALVVAFHGEVLNYHLALGGGDQARLHFYVAADPERLSEVHEGDLEERIRELIRSWRDRVHEGLERIRPPDEARRQARRYGDAFSKEYQASVDATVAVQDILELEAMQAEGRKVAITFSNRGRPPSCPDQDDVTELKLYLRGERLVLSDFMPILENAGFRVIAVNPFEVRGPGVEPAILYSFAVQDADGKQLDIAVRGGLLAETILAVREGDVSNDRMNSLVLKAGLHWREADVLRAYAAYAFQLGAVPGRVSLPNALVKHPHIARILFDLFCVRFDPDRVRTIEERREAHDEGKARFTQALQGVALLADDRALRRLGTLIEGTVRTNYYKYGGRVPIRRSGGVPYLSFKFAVKELQSIVRSRLVFEVWVRSSRMEGVHLRGARVARGGIRWSDRPDDFRTEILGLVKTQIVKNAVIVPGGSKGGFITLRHLGDAQPRVEEGKEQYRTLVRGLLDVTDNLDDDGRPLPPEGVICWDEPDPYLVVAADKGTAKFSDVANAVAAEYDFWLGDAFASGGSHGYDHKRVGITARGGWECVKRHFAEKGKDIQTDPFTVVGIGDMSGDVFGNGMLLSRKICLIAAFDHRHVFVDPTPDPERSFVERERMFAQGPSSWDDYDRSILSPGGFIVPRGTKEVVLGAEAKRVLGIAEDAPPMDGESLIRIVLKAPVELLWNGGIGTYVKASSETNADVGDASNDAVRVDADQLRCEVVGEGGNLGFTQLARVEYALRAGRLNTDALDNSGGVDLSDHEVNLKILMGPAVRSGRMSEDKRNHVLERLTGAVAELVLEDNRSQSQAISLDELRVRDALDDYRDLMTTLERAGVLDRASEFLPDLETLVERKEAGLTLTRPELCVLLAYAKLSVGSQLLRSSLPDDPITAPYLLGYFPAAAVREAGQESLASHRLKREIIVTRLTSDLVDMMGSAFVSRLVRDTGHTLDEVVRAWLIAARLAGHRALLDRMDEQEAPLSAQMAYRWLLGLSRVLERTARWVLQNVPQDVPAARVIDDYSGRLAELRRHFGEIVVGDDRETFQRLVQDIRELGADGELAANLITLRFLDQLLEILRVARETGADPRDTARAFYRISDLLQVPWLRGRVLESARDDRWEQRAAQALADDLTRAHHRLVAQVMKGRPDAGDVDAAADGLFEAHDREVARFRTLMDEIKRENVSSLSGLSVAVREIAMLSERLNGVPA